MRLLIFSTAIFVTACLARPGLSAPPAPPPRPPMTPGPDGRLLVRQTCGTCHTLGKGDKASEGPTLYGVVGRKAGAMSGFNYSPAFRKVLGGKVWTPQLLDRWLTDSQAVAPNSGMAFFNDNPAQRKAIIDYLSKP